MAKKKGTSIPDLGELQTELMEAAARLGEAEASKALADKEYNGALTAHESAVTALRNGTSTVMEKFE